MTYCGGCSAYDRITVTVRQDIAFYGVTVIFMYMAVQVLDSDRG